VQRKRKRKKRSSSHQYNIPENEQLFKLSNWIMFISINLSFP